MIGHRTPAQSRKQRKQIGTWATGLRTLWRRWTESGIDAGHFAFAPEARDLTRGTRRRHVTLAILFARLGVVSASNSVRGRERIGDARS
jgi:hypothetical protein